MSVKIKIMGNPSINVDGERLNLPLKKAEAIIYYLALEGKSEREKLTYLLWGSKDELSAQNNFRNALYLLKRYLPRDFLLSDRRYVWLANAGSDLEQIQLLKNISNIIQPDICEELLKNFDIPNNNEFNEWLFSARSRIKEEIIESLRVRITLCYDAEDEDKLEESLEKLVSLDPFDEDSVLELMDLYFKRKGAAKAAILYKAYRSRLIDEIGMNPSTRAEDFYRRVIISENSKDSIGDNPESYFYGRKNEQQLILDRIAKKQDQKVVFLIEGEAGVGKTSLIRKMLALLENETSVSFSTMSYEAGIDYPYSSWNNLVSHAALYADAEKIIVRGLDLSLLAGVFPNFMSDKRMTYNADLVKMSEKTPIVIGQAVSEFLTQVSSGRKLILVIEDLHWFDKHSLLLLEILLTTLSIPATIFITTRPEKSEYALSKLKRIESSGMIELLHISLSPFDETETASFCQLFLDKKIIESKDKDYFFKESEGLPLLIVEIIKMLRSDSDAGITRGGLGGVMLARFGEISEKHREFLRILSVFAGGAQVSAIAQFMGSTLPQIASLAEELINRKLIKEVESIEGNTLVEFRHAKVRESVYELIPSFQRKEYHSKAANILSQYYSPRTWDPALSSMLCYHYTKAGLPEKVLNQHLQEMIFDITLNHDLFPLIQDHVLLSCNNPFRDRSETEKKMDEISDLLHILNRTVPNNYEVLKMQASYLELRGGYLIGWGEYREGRIFINRAMQIAKEYSFNKIHIHCLMHMGHHFLQTDNWSSLLQCSREMLRLAIDEDRDKYIGIALRFIGVAFQIKGDFVRSEKILRRSIQVFEEQALTGNRYTLSILAAECYIGENYHWQGVIEKATESFEKCIRTCEEKGLFWGSSYFHAQMADVAFDMNDMKVMFEHIYKGSEIFERYLGGRSGSILYSLKSIADAIQGRYADSLRSLEIGELLSAPIKKRSWIAVHVMAKAYLAEMREKGSLPPEFDMILTKTAKEYAAESIELYSQLPAPHRVKVLTRKFGR